MVDCFLYTGNVVAFYNQVSIIGKEKTEAVTVVTKKNKVQLTVLIHNLVKQPKLWVRRLSEQSKNCQNDAMPGANAARGIASGPDQAFDYSSPIVT